MTDEFDLPDWLRDDDEEPSSPASEPEQPQTPPSSEPIPDHLGVTSMLPWRDGESDPGQSEPVDFSDWLEDMDDDSDTALATDEALPDWLDAPGEDGEPEPEAPASETPQAPRIRRLDEAKRPPAEDEMTFEEWERQQRLQDDESEALPGWLDTPDEDVEPAPEAPASETPQAPRIRRLDEAKRPPSEDELTFEEWERLQHQQEYEQEHAEELAMQTDIPDWFRDNVDIGDAASEVAALLVPDLEPEPAPQQPTVEADEDYVPEWFLGLEEQNLEDAPEWVREAASGDVDALSFDQLAAEEEPPTPVEAPPAFDEVPDWFQGIGGVEIDAEETPDWLTEFGAPEEAPQQEPAVPAPVDEPLFMTEEDEDVAGGLEWLDDIEGMDFASTPTDTAPPTPAEAALAEPAPPPSDSDDDDMFATAGDIDDLLGLVSTAPHELVPTGVDRELAKEAAADVDDLFDGVEDDLFGELDAAQADTEDVAESAFESEGPEWVEELRPDLQVKLSAGGLALDFEEQSTSHLPEELRALYEQSSALAQAAPEDAETTPDDVGPLAGITGGLAPAISETGDVHLATEIVVTDRQAQRIELLSSALEVMGREPVEDEEEPEAKPRPARRKPARVRPKRGRFLISLLLLAVMLGPFASDAFHVAEEPDLQSVGQKQQIVMAAIAALEPGDRVLLAFEYGPTAAGELNGLAEAVLRDILRQRAVPITISTNPLGTLNARYVLEKLASDDALLDAMERDEELAAGQDYYSMRYLAGGAVAVRGLSQSKALATLLFATDSTGETTDLDIEQVGADDFALVLVIGEGGDEIRTWAEQFGVEDLPKFALVTAAAEPFASAYSDTDGDLAYWGYLAGYRDTYRYNQIRNQGAIEEFETDADIPDPNVSQWHSMALGVLMAGLIIMLGLVYNTVRELRRRR